MARQRRGGGFKPPELRGTLGTLLRTAAAQVGPLREALGDALERTAREGRSRIDDARAKFDARGSGSGSDRRTEALADLGEIVLDLIRRGEIDPEELPEVRDVVAQLDELDSAAEDAAAFDFRPERHVDDHDDRGARPPARNRFDSRGRPAAAAAADSGPVKSRRDDEGTASSRSWSPPKPPARPAPRVWRPPADVEISAAPDEPADPVDSGPDRRRHVAPLPRRNDPARKGGISFEDDDDLADYMHPDDVPPKKPSDSDS